MKSKSKAKGKREKAKVESVAIVGLGLMGGSLAAALRKKMPKVRIIGITRRREALRTALKSGWIHQGSADVAEGVREADLIVLCTPVQTFPAIFRVLMRAARPGALVTDVGSVKADVFRRLPGFRGRLNYVSAHPMVGSHLHGIEAVNPKLYERGFAFVIRDSQASSAAYRCVKDFWALVMPRVIEISAKEHDRITAEISHMPHALSACLMQAADPKALPYAATGFRDMTRLSAGSPDIWLPIFQANRQATGAALERVIRQIRRFQKLLKSPSSKALQSFLAKAEKERVKL